jgi:hypothetical protein
MKSYPLWVSCRAAPIITSYLYHDIWYGCASSAAVANLFIDNEFVRSLARATFTGETHFRESTNQAMWKDLMWELCIERAD